MELVGGRWFRLGISFMLRRLFASSKKTALEPRADQQRPKPTLAEQVSEFTLCRESKINSLIQLRDHVEGLEIPGDYVECGVYKGGTAAVLAQRMRADRRIWLYDSFEGMPPTSEKDGTEAPKWVGECVGTENDVREILRRLRVAPERYVLRKGWFSDTFQGELPEQIAFLHVDADWFDSVSLVLETFYDRVAEGGVIVMDDFGHWEGCREAFYDFCARRGLRPLLERFENDQAYWFKGKLHNREGWLKVR